MDAKANDKLTVAEQVDLGKVFDTAKVADVDKQEVAELIVEKKGADLGLSRPTEIIHENIKEGVRVREIIDYVHPPTHPGWGAEAGRRYIVEKL